MTDLTVRQRAEATIKSLRPGMNLGLRCPDCGAAYPDFRNDQCAGCGYPDNGERQPEPSAPLAGTTVKPRRKQPSRVRENKAQAFFIVGRSDGTPCGVVRCYTMGQALKVCSIEQGGNPSDYQLLDSSPTPPASDVYYTLASFDKLPKKQKKQNRTGRRIRRAQH